MELQKIAKIDIENWKKLTKRKSVNMKFLCELLPYFCDAKDEQLLFLTPSLKKRIGENLGWKEETCLNRCSVELNKLRNLEVITRVDQQVYQLNPNYIGLGADFDVNKLKRTFEVKGKRKKRSSTKSLESEPRIEDRNKQPIKKSQNRKKKYRCNKKVERNANGNNFYTRNYSTHTNRSQNKQQGANFDGMRQEEKSND